MTRLLRKNKTAKNLENLHISKVFIFWQYIILEFFLSIKSIV